MFAGLRKISTFASAIAEIAQLVEHNLAKVRVASSSLVFRSKQEGQCRDTLAFFIPCRESGIKKAQFENLGELVKMAIFDA